MIAISQNFDLQLLSTLISIKKVWCIIHHTLLSQYNKKNSGYSVTRPSIEISTKTHLLEFFTVIQAVKNQIKCKLLNKRSRDISLVPITWPNLPCLPEREWRLSLFIYTFQRRKTHSAFQTTYVHLTGSVFLTDALLLRLNNNQSIRAARWNTTWSCSKYLTFIALTTAAFYATELLNWGKSGKYRNEYELSFLVLFIYSCTLVSYPSLFSRTYLVTIYYWYQMNSEQDLKDLKD